MNESSQPRRREIGYSRYVVRENQADREQTNKSDTAAVCQVFLPASVTSVSDHRICGTRIRRSSPAGALVIKNAFLRVSSSEPARSELETSSGNARNRYCFGISLQNSIVPVAQGSTVFIDDAFVENESVRTFRHQAFSIVIIACTSKNTLVQIVHGFTDLEFLVRISRNVTSTTYSFVFEFVRTTDETLQALQTPFEMIDFVHV